MKSKKGRTFNPKFPHLKHYIQLLKVTKAILSIKGKENHNGKTPRNITPTQKAS